MLRPPWGVDVPGVLNRPIEMLKLCLFSAVNSQAGTSAFNINPQVVVTEAAVMRMAAPSLFLAAQAPLGPTCRLLSPFKWHDI